MITKTTEIDWQSNLRLGKKNPRNQTTPHIRKRHRRKQYETAIKKKEPSPKDNIELRKIADIEEQKTLRTNIEAQEEIMGVDPGMWVGIPAPRPPYRELS